MLAKMEQAGLVTRFPAVKDRRALEVELTQVGNQTLLRATPIYMTCVQQAFGRELDDAEASNIARLLHRVKRSYLRHESPSSGRGYLVPFGETVLSVTH